MAREKEKERARAKARARAEAVTDAVGGPDKSEP